MKVYEYPQKKDTKKTSEEFPVAMRLGDTPVPIPNTMVKTRAADGTMLETAWESRWLPDSLKWGCSSAGRAPALQAGGQGFESLHLHWIRTERDFREPYLTCTLKIAYRKRYNIFNTEDTRHPRKRNIACFALYGV